MQASVPQRTADELARLGSLVFEQRVRSLLHLDDEGKFIAIDVQTGDYELDDDDYEAVTRLRLRHSTADVWLAKVGEPAAYLMRRDR